MKEITAGLSLTIFLGIMTGCTSVEVIKADSQNATIKTSRVQNKYQTRREIREAMDGAALEKAEEILGKQVKQWNVDCKDEYIPNSDGDIRHVCTHSLAKDGIDTDNASLIELANNNENEAIRQRIESGANVNETDDSGRSPLYIAVWSGNIELMAMLIKAGAKIDLTSISKDRVARALNEAINMNYPEVVKWLLAAGANVHGKDENGNTPLLLAAQCKVEDRIDAGVVRIDLIAQLLKAGAKIQSGNNEGKTALHEAISYTCPASVIKYLLKNGANPNAKTSRKSILSPNLTPIQYTFDYKGEEFLEIVDLLISHGAKINVRDQHGCTIIRDRIGKDFNSIEALEARGLQWSACDRESLRHENDENSANARQRQTEKICNDIRAHHATMQRCLDKCSRSNWQCKTYCVECYK